MNPFDIQVLMYRMRREKEKSMARAKDRMTEAIAQAEESFAGPLDGKPDEPGAIDSQIDGPAEDKPFTLTDRDMTDEIEKVNRIWAETNPPVSVAVPEPPATDYLPAFDPQEVLADIERKTNDAMFRAAYERIHPDKKWADVPYQERTSAIALAKAHRNPMIRFTQIIATL